MRTNILTLILLFIASTIFAQTSTIHGYIKDHENGEVLIGASVLIKEKSTGTVTNLYGFYSMTLKNGNYTLIFSYMGYQDVSRTIELNGDLEIIIELEPSSEKIEEVVVTAKAQNHKIVSTQIGVERLNSKTIEKIPSLMGEADVLKALKLMPGVVSTSEMSSNLSIRGGARDQNLLILDEATVYNASHLLGMFSVFNNDALKSVEMYKGMIPVNYGGRLSSAIDIRMKDGNAKRFSGVGSVGSVATRLTIEAPLIKDKASILVSGRRTYLDLLMKGAKKLNDQIEELPYYFYDFNAKANYTINNKHRIYLSGYFGKDVSRYELSEDDVQNTQWGNYTATFRWNYMLSNRHFANLTLLSSKYSYKIESKSSLGEGEDRKYQSFKWDAFLKDYTAKLDFSYYMNSNNTLKYGISSTYHDFNVGSVTGKMDTMKYDFAISKYYSMEHAAYIGNTQSISPKLKAEYGLRLSVAQNIGEGTNYDIENYEITDTLKYSKNEVFNTYSGLEPRLFFTYIINQKNSFKIGYARTAQYVHIASNSNAGTPIDVWMPVSPNVKPQFANQVSGGYFRNFLDNKIETSIELYYKRMENQIEFREFSTPYLNPYIESDLRFGKGRAYGAEFMVRKDQGKLTGWVSYTLSKSERKIEDIQEKDWYPSPYDHRHNLSIVGMYDITNRISISANWVFLSGKPFDAPVARFEYGGAVLPYYGSKNASRHPNYHRLDFSVEIHNKPRKRFNSYWSFSVYNSYNRKNANLIYFESEGTTTKAFRYSLLPRMYAVAYNFKF